MTLQYCFTTGLVFQRIQFKKIFFIDIWYLGCWLVSKVVISQVVCFLLSPKKPTWVSDWHFKQNFNVTYFLLVAVAFMQHLSAQTTGFKFFQRLLFALIHFSWHDILLWDIWTKGFYHLSIRMVDEKLYTWTNHFSYNYLMCSNNNWEKPVITIASFDWEQLNQSISVFICIIIFIVFFFWKLSWNYWNVD